MYGAQANSFTIKGRTNIHSYTGVSCSIVHLFALLMFTCLKLTHLITKYKPDISIFDEANRHQTEEDGI